VSLFFRLFPMVTGAEIVRKDPLICPPIVESMGIPAKLARFRKSRKFA
jgi:hypothetical protein